MKKLLIATDNFLPRVDGIAVFLDKVVPELSKSYDITIVAPDFEGKRIWYDGVKIVRIPLSGRVIGDYPAARYDREKIKELIKDKDIVWTHSAGPIGSTASWYGRRQRKKVVTTVHSVEWELFFGAITFPRMFSWLFKFMVKWYVKNVYKRADVLTVSSKVIEDYLEENGVKNKKLLVPFGVDTEKFKPALYKKAAKRKIGFDEDKNVIIYVGRIAREKNLIDLLEACEGSGALLVIVGDGVVSLKRRLKRGKALVTGFVDNVEDYLQAADVYVIPSSTETSSLSTLEAMGSGLAVVSTGVGGMKEYLRDGENCLLFEVEDVSGLKENIDKLLNNSGLRKRLGKEARKTAMNYNWDNTFKKLKEVFEKI